MKYQLIAALTLALPQREVERCEGGWFGWRLVVEPLHDTAPTRITLADDGTEYLLSIVRGVAVPDLLYILRIA